MFESVRSSNSGLFSLIFATLVTVAGLFLLRSTHFWEPFAIPKELFLLLLGPSLCLFASLRGHPLLSTKELAVGLGIVLIVALGSLLWKGSSLTWPLVPWVSLLTLALSLRAWVERVGADSAARWFCIWVFGSGAALSGLSLGGEVFSNQTYLPELDSFFGNPSHSAEVLGITLVCGAYLLIEKRGASLCLLFALFLVPLVALFLTGSRGVMLALCFVSLFFLRWRSALVLLPLCIGFLGVLTWIGPGKWLSAEGRFIRWGNTIKMIADYPWGYGLGSFPSAYLPFSRAFLPDPEVSEGVLITDPHNSLLQVGAELGLPICFSILALLVRALLSTEQSNYGKPNRLALGILGFVSVSGLSSPFLMTSVAGFSFCFALALIFSRLSPQIFISRKLGGFLAFACMILFVPIGLYFNARVKEGTYSSSSPQSFDASCARVPFVWRVCLKAVRAHLEAGNPSAATEPIGVLKRYHPNLLPVLLWEARWEAALGNRHRVCRILRRYEDLLGRKPEFWQEMEKTCGG